MRIVRRKKKKRRRRKGASQRILRMNHRPHSAGEYIYYMELFGENSALCQTACVYVSVVLQCQSSSGSVVVRARI